MLAPLPPPPFTDRQVGASSPPRGDVSAVFDRNVNGWVQVPSDLKLPDNQQDRDMLARELLIKFQMSKTHPLVDLRNAYAKF